MDIISVTNTLRLSKRLFVALDHPPSVTPTPARDMSAFLRRQPLGRAVEVGVRPGLHGQTLLSTGIADLDRLLGGGLPLGSLLLLLEDSHSQQHLAFIKHYLAEGVACGHSAAWLAPRPVPGGAAAFVPSVAAARQDSGAEVTAAVTSTKRRGVAAFLFTHVWMAFSQAAAFGAEHCRSAARAG